MSAAIAGHLSRRHSDASEVLNFVVGGMLFHLGQTGHNPLEGIDVEELISAAELLGERQSLQISPFVSAWHPTVEWLDRPEGLRRGGGFPSDSLRRGLGSERVDDKARSIEEAIRSAVKPGDGHIYRSLAREMTRALVSLVEVSDPASVQYLSPLANLAREQGRLVVATLNYDRSVEVMGENVGCPVDTGIDSWASGRLLFGSEGIVLLKLHGSTDWVVDRSYEAGSVRSVIVRRRNETEGLYTLPALVFGQRNKLQAEGPFLDLLLAFRDALEEVSHVTVVGYSFRDRHVNHYLAGWLNADNSRTMTVAGLGFAAHVEGWWGSEPEFVQDLRRIDRERRGEERPENPRIKFIQGHANDLLPALAGGV